MTVFNLTTLVHTFMETMKLLAAAQTIMLPNWPNSTNVNGNVPNFNKFIIYFFKF